MQFYKPGIISSIGRKRILKETVAPTMLKEKAWSKTYFKAKCKINISQSVGTPGELNTGAEGALHTTVSASNVL